MSDTVDLVLEGGGVKGIGLVGAISVLEEHGMTFARVAGASAGAIVGSLVAAGMCASDLQALMTSLDYTRFRDDTKLDHLPVVGKGLSLWLDHGIYAGDHFHGWIRDQLSGLGVDTFHDLYQADPGSSLPANEQYKLVVMTSDVSRGATPSPAVGLHLRRHRGGQAIGSRRGSGVDVDPLLLPARDTRHPEGGTLDAR